MITLNKQQILLPQVLSDETPTEKGTTETIVSMLGCIVRSFSKAAVTPTAVRSASAIRSYSLNSPISDEEFAEMMKQMRMDPVSKWWRTHRSESIEKAHRSSFRRARQHGSSIPDESLDKAISLGGGDRRSWLSRGFVIVSMLLQAESAREANQVHEWVSSLNVTHITEKIDWVIYSSVKSFLEGSFR